MNQEEEDKELQKIFPFFKSWKQLYAFILGELVLLIVLFYFFSRFFA